jgi:hypothetical protein
VRRGIKAVLVLISLAYAMPVHVHSRRMPWVNDHAAYELMQLYERQRGYYF